MSAPLFTPGPWVIESKEGREDARGYWIAVRSDYVAMVCRQNDEAAELPNANLIASAPDLHEALRSLLEAFDKGGDADDWPTEVIIAARAALAKARGEANSGQDIAPQNGGGM